MRDLRGSWIKITSMVFLLFSKIMLVRALFFLTFYEKIFKVSLIIVSYCLQLSKSSWS